MSPLFRQRSIGKQQHISCIVSQYIAVMLRNGRGRTIIAWSYRWRDHLIWGATARILKQFLDLLEEE